MYLMIFFIYWHILAVISIRVRWIAPSSGASSHHLCVWKLRSSCCSSHSLLLNTDPCHGSDPIVAAAARFRTHFITLCFVYRVKVSNSTTSIPFDASWWLNDTDSSLQQFVNMRWYYVLYCTNTYNNHTRKWKYFRWFKHIQKSNEVLYSILELFFVLFITSCNILMHFHFLWLVTTYIRYTFRQITSWCLL